MIVCYFVVVWTPRSFRLATTSRNSKLEFQVGRVEERFHDPKPEVRNAPEPIETKRFYVRMPNLGRF